MNSSVRTYFTNKKTFVSFVLSILVFFIHFKVFSTFSDIGKGLSVFFNAIYSTTRVAVPLFFVISGVMFYRNYTLRNTLQKWKSRFFSLCIPYFIWNSLWFLLALVGCYTPLGGLLGGVTAELSISNILGGIFLNKYFEPFWFIRKLILFVALCPLFYLLLKNKLTGIISIIAVFIFNCFECKIDFLSYLLGEPTVYYLIGAYMGVHYFEIFESRKKKSYTFSGFLIYILCCVFWGVREFLPEYISIEPVNIIVNVISCAALWIGFDFFDFKSSPRFLKYSFLIYAMHSFVGAAVSKILFLIFSSNTAFLPIVAAVSFPLTIIIICAVGMFLEKYFPKLNKILVGR